jgi:hypothetical protein
MILRSVMRHVREQNWVAVCLDFLIVVVGVFIGIQVANWNEAQEEQRRLNEQLSSLRAEFVENLARFEIYGNLLQRKIADIHALRRLISGADFNASESELDAMLMNTFSVPVFTADRTTLEELKRSGALRDLTNIGLRRPLVDWDEAYAGLGRLEGDAITLRNVLANQIRVGRITLDGAQSIQIEAEQLLDGREFAVDSAEVLRLAAESGRSAYDCEFVVLADYFDVPLYSADRRLVERFPGRARLLAD